MDDTIQTFITAIGENINDDPASIKIEGIDYDANGNILLKYEEIPEGERKYTLAVSEGSLEIGDVVTVSENKQLNTVNGVAATNTQQDDYNKVSDKIFCHQEKETYEFIYDSVSVEEKEYNVTVKRIASRKLDNTGKTTEAESAYIYSLDKPYSNGIQEITIYFHGDGINGDAMEGVVVIELKGDDSISGLYKATIPGAEQ